MFGNSIMLRYDYHTPESCPQPAGCPSVSEPAPYSGYVPANESIHIFGRPIYQPPPRQPIYQPSPVFQPQPVLQPAPQPIYQPQVQQPVFQPVPVFQPAPQPQYVPQSQYIPQPQYVPQPAPQPSSNTQAQAFIDAHNTFRNDTNPPATNMKPITWSNNLTDGAASWAAKCNFKHSQTPGVGENLYASSRRTPNPSTYNPREAVDSWGNEGAFYDYNSNSCEPGKTCGHYTQVVWADSDKVGCAVQDCPTVQGVNWPNGGTMVVCQYSPPGNYVGRKPYETR